MSMSRVQSGQQVVARQWLFSPERFYELGLVLAALLFFFYPHPPWSWALLAVVAVLAWLRPAIAVALLPLTFPYFLTLKPLTSHALPAFSIGEIGLVICLAAAVLRTALLKQHRTATWQVARDLWPQVRPFVLPALLFFVGASLALLASPHLHISLRSYREDIVEPLLFFVLLLRYIRTRADLVRMVASLVLSGLFCALVGVYQGVFHVKEGLNILSATSFRVDGPVGNPNQLAFILERTVPLVLALALTLIVRRRGQSAGDARPFWRAGLRWACLLALIPLLWATWWTSSRGAEVALLAVGVALLVLEVRRWYVLVPLLGGGAALVAVYWSRLLAVVNAGHGNISQRFLLWKAALLIIRDHPLLGTGVDSFNVQYDPRAPNSYALKALDGKPFPEGYNPQLSHPHNLFLDAWISVGLLGLVGFFWLIGAFAWTLVRTYRLCAALAEGTLLQRLLLGIGGCMLAGLVHGLVDNGYFLPDQAMYFWCFIGLVLVIQRLAQGEHPALPHEAEPAAPLVASAS